jgi:hypothetical protein
MKNIQLQLRKIKKFPINRKPNGSTSNFQLGYKVIQLDKVPQILGTKITRGALLIEPELEASP